jgi:5'(3')-deoxyribonucleotidase
MSNTKTKKRGLNLALDIDGVLATTTEDFLKVLSSASGYRIPEELVTKWDLYECIKGYLPEGMSKDNLWQIFDDWMQKRGETVGVYPGAVESVKSIRYNMSDRVDNIYLITARGHPTQKVTKAWHSYHFKDVTDGLIFSPHKGEVCKALSIDVMVDDSPSNVVDIARHGTIPILVDQLYNRDVKGYYRINNLTELESILKKIKK